MRFDGLASTRAAVVRGAVTAVYDDPSSGCLFVAATPPHQPELWLAYLDGARRSYRKHGVESVLEYDTVADGATTSLFFAAINRSGSVVGGMRVQGPHTHADHTHAVSEWAGRAGTEQLKAEIDARVADGVIEMKTGWRDDDADHRRELTDALARIFVHALRLMRVRHSVGTVGQHAVRRWHSSGGTVCDRVPPVAYPTRNTAPCSCAETATPSPTWQHHDKYRICSGKQRRCQQAANAATAGPKRWHKYWESQTSPLGRTASN